MNKGFFSNICEENANHTCAAPHRCACVRSSERSDVSARTTHARTKYLRACSPSEQKQRLEVGLSWQQGGLRESPVVWLCYASERAADEMNGSEGMRGGVLLKSVQKGREKKRAALECDT